MVLKAPRGEGWDDMSLSDCNHGGMIPIDAHVSFQPIQLLKTFYDPLSQRPKLFPDSVDSSLHLHSKTWKDLMF